MSAGFPTKIARSRSSREAFDLFQHLGVVVGRQQRLAVAPRPGIGSHPTKSVSQA